MWRTIVGFNLDEQDDWVAKLSCGHGQHVRHNPPWIQRPWVLNEHGRQKKMGALLDCKICDQDESEMLN
ncbi:MAG: DUF3565 domain-containing protein [Granulosicoccus sp.]